MALTADGFERLLALLGPDRETAGEQYELARLKLVKYFEARSCPEPDDLADETIDRVARRLAGGETIRSPEFMRYIYGVARNVLLEQWKRERRSPSPLLVAMQQNASASNTNAEWRLDCFQECLRELTPASRDLLLQYYEKSGQQKIDARNELARELGVPLNALRIRIHRIKAGLERCMGQCMKRVLDFATTDGRRQS